VTHPLITICVPVYNGARYLRHCIDSLLGQTYGDFALVIGDNASTDSTREIGEAYARADCRVRYHRHERNIGLYGNWNFLLRSVDSKYVKMAPADDYWSPTWVGDALEQLEKDPSVVLCYPLTTMVDAHGNETEKYDYRLHVMDAEPATRFRRVLTEIRLVNQLTGVIRTEAVRRTLPILQHTVGDRIYVAELSLYGKIFHLDGYHYFRRFHEGASSFHRDSETHQVTYVLAEGASKLRYEAWKYHSALLRRVARSPLRSVEKGKLFSWLARSTVWDRQRLAADIVATMRG
jgi:glycosyltransferase involved in cell wall biosynthesis